MVRTFGQVTVINAGTLFREHSPCFAVVDFEACHVQFFDLLASDAIGSAELHDIGKRR